MARTVNANDSIFIIRTKVLVASISILFGSIANARVQKDDPTFAYVKSLDGLKASLSLPVVDQTETVKASDKVLRIRAKRPATDNRVEPITLKVPVNLKELAGYVKERAKKGRTTALYDYLTNKIYKAKSEVGTDATKRVTLDYEGYQLFDSAKLASTLSKTHRSVDIKSEELLESPQTVKSLIRQVKDFLPEEKQKSLIAKLQGGTPIHVETDLLPSFAQRVVKRFTPFKGPNCFHAALAFHSESMAKSPYMNVKEEEGYHTSMINYDELWRAIQANFYEVNVSSSPLRYGDMIVFFELPPESSHDVYYRWIRHAATYLFGNYTFSKGSKSPDTPYTIKTVEEEWRTWHAFSKNLGVKVFRRDLKNVRTRPPKELIEWVY